MVVVEPVYARFLLLSTVSMMNKVMKYFSGIAAVLGLGCASLTV